MGTQKPHNLTPTNKLSPPHSRTPSPQPDSRKLCVCVCLSVRERMRINVGRGLQCRSANKVGSFRNITYYRKNLYRPSRGRRLFFEVSRPFGLAAYLLVIIL